MYIPYRPFSTEFDWPETWCLIEVYCVSTRFYICTYYAFTLWGRAILTASLKCVLIKPGAMLLTLMPFEASCGAKPRTRPCKAVLLVAYTAVGWNLHNYKTTQCLNYFNMMFWNTVGATHPIVIYTLTKNVIVNVSAHIGSENFVKVKRKWLCC